MRNLKGDQSEQGHDLLTSPQRKLATACGTIGTIFLPLCFGWDRLGVLIETFWSKARMHLIGMIDDQQLSRVGSGLP